MNANSSGRIFSPKRRTLATGLLVLAAAVFATASAMGSSNFWIGLIEATAEAALVGGLADWFAVTALFRRPLGLPIPHTAVIPMNKDRIGRGLAEFIGKTFFQPEGLASAARKAESGRRLGAWLSDKGNAHAAARGLLEVAQIGAAGDLAAAFLRPALQKADMRPLLDLAAESLSKTELDAVLLDDVLHTAKSFLRRRARHLDEAASRRRQGLLRRSLDRQVMRAIMEGLERLLDDLSDKDNPSRKALLQSAQARIRDALLAGDHTAHLRSFATQIAGSPQFEAWLTALFEAEPGGGSDAARKAREAAAAGVLMRLGERLGEDSRLGREADDVIAMTLAEMAPLRDALTGLVSEVVAGYESDAFAERIEQAVEDDLQFIRINGAVIGAVVGCLLFIARRALG